MGTPLSGKERVRLALAHREADRVPLYEGAFSSTLASRILGRTVFIPSTGGSSFRHFLLANQEGLQAASACSCRLCPCRWESTPDWGST
jgi:hypothetical protein